MKKLDPLSLPPLDPRQRYNTTEAAAYLRISRAQLYKHISSGDIESFTDGVRRFVPGWAIAAKNGAEAA